MIAAALSRLDKFVRPAILRGLGPHAAVKLYSAGRHFFLKQLISERPREYAPPAVLSRTLWGVNFRAPLFNAAGVFKLGEGYELTAAQGAGAYLAGTTTSAPRRGNDKEGIAQPFAPYPRSQSASNWLGLPNPGHLAVAERLASLTRVPGCPIGVSVAGAPELLAAERLVPLSEGLRAYADARVDFIELNESCPNTEAKREQHELTERLTFIAENFLALSKRPPVIVKFSTDTPLEMAGELVRTLVSLGFDGVNFGNTSTAYALRREALHASELELYDYFVNTFGGGVSGAPLRADSLRLLESAREALEQLKPAREFHIIRTGGIDCAADVQASLAAGASLAEWYTGYFDAFAREGHRLYAALFEAMLQ